MSVDAGALDLGLWPAGGPAQVAAYRRALELHEARLLIRPRIVPIASPLAGADWAQQVPGGIVWYLQAATARLVADATITSRTPRLTLTDGTNTLLRAFPAANVTQSITGLLSWVRNYGDHLDFGGANGQVATWPSIPLVGGMVLQMVTTNLQAADQWSQIVLYVLEVRQRTLNELAQLAEDLDAGRFDDTYPGLRLGL